MKRNLPQALTAVLAVLDVLVARSRRLGAQHAAEPAPLELLLVVAHAAVPDLPAFLVLFLVPFLFLVLFLVLSLVLPVDMVPVAVMVTVLVLLLLPVAVGEVLSVVGLMALLLPDLSVAVLLHQELRLHLVAAEAAAAAPLGSGEM